MEEPRYLGHYRLLECLAYGGMGEVWKARDTKLDRIVAIKLLRSEWRHTEDFVARFKTEAQLLASLHHPNIVKIHNFYVSEDTEAPLMYMVMDYVEGQTLADYIRNTSGKSEFPPPADILYIFTVVGLALDYSHAHNMIHRDIKPANILLDQRMANARPMGEPILTDFGIARRQGVSSGTIIGSILGTPLYVAPEQAQGNYDEKRSDLYSLGIILYEMMTGITPFRNAAAMALVVQHIYEAPTRPELINPAISPELSNVILKCIEKKPSDRFPTASALSIALANAFHLPIPEALRQYNTSANVPNSQISLSYIPGSVSSPGIAGVPGPQSSAGIPGYSGNAGSVSSPGIAGVPGPVSSPGVPGYPDNAGKHAPVSLSGLQQQPQQISQSGLSSLGVSALPGRPSGPQNNTVAPATHRSPAPSAAISPAGSFYSPVPFPTSPTKPRLPFFKNKRLTALLVLIVVLIVGVSATIFWVSSQPTSVQAVGQLHFSSSVSSSKAYDTLQIDIQNVPPPPAGKIYVAWIDQVANESNHPHWQLQLNHDNSIHMAHLTYPAFNNLLLPNSLFVITLQDDGSSLIVPSASATDRLYYARLGAQPSPAIELNACPADPKSTTCF